MSDQEPKSGIRMIHVQSRFSRMALRDGGIAANDAIAAAESFIEEQRPRYFQWIAADLIQLDQNLSVLGRADELSRPAHDAAYYKAAHIRDLGGTFGYEIITAVADSLCELLYRMSSAGQYSHPCIETHRAALKLVCTPDVEAMNDASKQILLDGLHRVVQRYPAPAGPEAEKAGAGSET